ncbi:cobyric acid synthase (plasmid) [Halorarum halophilum]|uniref:Probable cobyric acid synthase n=1 Tax=Halorarum halophilum TaxID=2743090 RepID=A0A7D5L319_9EURY|nr:cobyric acid synthase [Halobaculum halophilum]QLG29703.1 cobyric acid synthase [Halobaculum halophilum]
MTGPADSSKSSKPSEPSKPPGRSGSEERSESDEGGEPGRAPTLLVVGTASHVGKSTVAAGLCRLLADRGDDVAPFKAQNMSNNGRVVPTPDGDWGEIGVSQYTQAQAARTPATTDCNPVLLKPRGAGESQLVLNGEAVAHYPAGEYYEEHWDDALAAAEAAHARLAAEHDVVVAEGAGSAAEPNLSERDLANVETARFADARVVLVADIERGGAFASIVGTLELMPEALADRVAGAVITKFRGDDAILAPALEDLTERTGVPVLGVLPHDDPGLPAEDSVSLPAEGEFAVVGDDDGVLTGRTVTVGVPRLPRVSNFTDFDPLARVPGVRVAYLPLGADLDGCDALVLPGTKNTVDDLLALRTSGFDERLADFEGPVLGLCGGYQLLGERITNADVEGTGEYEDADEFGGMDGVDDGAVVEGFGLLPVETAFSPEKRVEVTEAALDGTAEGPFAGSTGTVSGYEIHMGETTATGAVSRPLGPGSAARGLTAGTYLHGLFENESALEGFVDATFRAAGRERPPVDDETGNPYDAAAELLREHVDPESLLGPVVE